VLCIPDDIVVSEMMGQLQDAGNTQHLHIIWIYYLLQVWLRGYRNTPEIKHAEEVKSQAAGFKYCSHDRTVRTYTE